MRDKKRYVIQLDMQVQADNDYMARKYAHELKDAVEISTHAQNVKVTEIGEQPYASLDYNKLKDISEPLQKLNGSPLTPLL